MSANFVKLLILLLAEVDQKGTYHGVLVVHLVEEKTTKKVGKEVEKVANQFIETITNNVVDLASAEKAKREEKER